MKKIALLSLLLGLVAAVAAAQPATVTFHASLSGANEFPGPGDPDGTGVAAVTISGTTLTYSVLTAAIGGPSVAHIHRAPAGASGPPVVDLNVNSLQIGSATITQTLANEITANPAIFYVNVHTDAFPNGAIRGQLVTNVNGSRSAYLPVVGRVTGLNNTNFVTDLRILNQSTETANVRLEFFPQSAAGQVGPTITENVTVAPGEQKVLNDVVGETFDTGGLGALQVFSDRNITVTSRIINDLRSNNLGTSGFAVSSNDFGDARTTGTLPFLIQDADFRTNIGFFNPSTVTVTATFTARRTSDGAVLGSNTVSIPQYSMQQHPVFNLISAVPEVQRVQHDFYVTWTSNVPLFVYASVIDFKTGDSVFID